MTAQALIAIEQYVTPREAAEFLRVPLSRIYDLSHRRAVRTFKFGKSLRFLKADLEDFARSGMRQAEA